MRPQKLNFIILLFTLLTLLLSSTFAWATEETAPKDDKKSEKKAEVIRTIKHVVIIGLEGVETKDLAQTTSLNGLASMGIKVSNLIPVKPEQFSVNMASLLTGLEPSHHGYLKQSGKLAGETIIDIYQRSNREVLFVDGSAGGLKDIGGRSKLFSQKPNSPKLAVDEIQRQFPRERPFLTSLFLTVNQGNNLKTVDQEIGRLFSFFYQQGVYEYTLFVVSGVKGNEGFAIYKGPGIKGGLMEQNSRLVDIFPTLVTATDGKAPVKTDGLVLWNIFTSGNGYSEQFLLQKRISELSNSQAELTNLLYLAQEEKRKALVEKGQAENQKEKVINTVNAKDQEIRSLEIKIGAMKLLGLMLVIGFGIGYIIEYFVLRKKFLMF